MELTKKDLGIVLSAIEDAISDRESFLDCHTKTVFDEKASTWKVVFMEEYGNIIKRTQKKLSEYRKLREKLLSKKGK
jgi:hypothetical protein